MYEYKSYTQSEQFRFDIPPCVSVHGYVELSDGSDLKNVNGHSCGVKHGTKEPKVRSKRRDRVNDWSFRAGSSNSGTKLSCSVKFLGVSDHPELLVHVALLAKKQLALSLSRICYLIKGVWEET